MRRRVLLLVAAATTLVLVAFLVPLALLVQNVAADRAVQRATVEAQQLTSLVATTDRQALADTVRQVDAKSPYEITVFADGARFGAPAERSPLVELAERGTSQSGEVPGGREIVFAVGGPGRDRAAVIRTFVSDAELARGVPRAWLLLGGLGLALLLVGLLVADRLARTFVRSTVDLAAVSHRLGGGELDARADETAPGELGVVASALNGLAGRIADQLREERETIADLSHRVRTPLTSLRMEADSIADPEVAERVSAGVDAVNRAVTEVIQQARRRGVAEAPTADAAAVVADRVAFWTVLAEDTDRELTVAVAPGPLPVALGRADLEAAVDALLGNVFAHTPNGAAFHVGLTPRPGGGAVLTVDDAGPGLPQGHHTGALRRGVSGSGSSGLGLDIVRRAAERTGGEVRLAASELGGLRVVVELGGLGPR